MIILKFKLKRNRSKSPKVKNKQSLSIVQSGQEIVFEGVFANSEYKVKELWAKARYHEDFIIKLAEVEPSANFKLTIQLDQILEQIKFEDDNNQDVLDFYLKVRNSAENISEKNRERFLENNAKFITINDQEYMEYFIRFGRFQNTQISGIEMHKLDNNFGVFGLTTKGNISFYYNNLIQPNIKLQTEKIVMDEDIIRIEGLIFTKNAKINSGLGILRNRTTNEELHTTMSFSDIPEAINTHFGLNRYRFQMTFNTASLINKELKDGILDAYMDLDLDTYGYQEMYRARVGRPTKRVKLFMKDLYAKHGDYAIVIRPYLTFKASNLSFETWNFPNRDFDVLVNSMKNARQIYKKNQNRDIWLVGERIYKAQDTGYRFFEYMRKEHPEKEVYYVIEKDSPEAANVEPLGNVLYYKSVEHIEKTMMATRIISSHHPDYLYPIRTKKYKNQVQGVKVFLQHGVMGTKNMVANYGKNGAAAFETDLFLVSSEFEKDMIVGDFGWAEEQVAVTGLSRFDSLFAKDVALKRQLLIIPTWRDWITSDEVFLESAYFERYKELVNHPALHMLAEKYDFEVVFCLHPNMQHFTHYFKEFTSVKVISQGEVDVQRLIKESAIMITDYSSVAFDFSFLHKPIIYYQFDQKRFLGKRPSHLNIEEDLPGTIAYEVENVLEELEGYAQNNFTMEDKYVKRASKFIQYRDQFSNERIYTTIQQATKHKETSDEWKMVQKYLQRRFRKSKPYFPTMKKLYKYLIKFTKIDKNLILFESGVGKQYSDSPKYIYEEIIRRKLPYKKVWVYDDILPVKDRNTIRIKRLSPQYYYYLAKAGYWVNNQNFPSYLNKRKETTYIQTWHGTPLKKMQFDIENVQGRDDGYLDRVYHASRQWSTLLSPSAYATKAFRSAFRYDGDIMESGYPRNDIFYRSDVGVITERIRQKLGLSKDKKVILYAPTFRDNQTTKNNKFTFELNFDLEKMKEALGNEYILLLRMHVVVSNNINIPTEYRDFVMDVSKYSDIQELYLVSDILMTDYSSVMFDFANTGRPILYYTYDLEDYRDNLRGFYLDFEEEAPGPFIKTTEEIINTVINIDQVMDQYKVKYDKFYKKFCGLEDGYASARVVDRFFDK